MAGRRREDITERQITGLKYFDKLAPLLERLHDDGCRAIALATGNCTTINTAC